jgi:hypothetical protein
MTTKTIVPAMTGSAITAVQRSAVARYVNAYRIAAYLMVLYTLGHTFGAVIGTPAFGSQSDAVVSSMKMVRVVAQGTERTWYDFFRGFGAFVSVFFIFSAWMVWYVGGLTPEDRRSFEPITWALVLAWAGGAVLAFTYFFTAPEIFSTVITLTLIGACVLDRRTAH